MPMTSPLNSFGFTLIELLMAMLIMTVGLLGLLQSVNVAYEHSFRTRLREEAVLLADEQMNSLRSNAVFKPQSVATRVIGGLNTKFVVNKQSELIAGDSNKLTVSVRWAFKNITTKHEIYAIKKM